MQLFISYSHKDRDYRDQLITCLAPLKNRGYIDHWSDREISPSKEWDHEIKTAFDNSNIIVLLITPDFLDSEYIIKEELEKAIIKHNNGEISVIPLFIRPSLIATYPEIKKLQGLPRNEKYVSTWENKDSAYLEIAEGIYQLVLDRTEEEAVLNTRRIKELKDVDIQGFKEKTIENNVKELDEKKLVYLSITSDKLEQKRRSIFYELDGMNEYEGWPYKVVPSPKEVVELLKLDEKEKENKINEYLDKSLFSIHIIDTDNIENENQETIELQYQLAKNRCSGSLFKCLIALNNPSPKNSFFEEISEAKNNNPNIKQISNWTPGLIIESLNSFIVENERKKEELQNSLNEEKNVFLLFDKTDMNNPLREEIKEKIEQKDGYNLSQCVTENYSEAGFKIRDYEKKELRKSDIAILLYGNAPEGWCLSRQASVLEEGNLNSKEMRAICLDEPDKPKKIKRVVNTKKFTVLHEITELTEYLEGL